MIIVWIEYGVLPLVPWAFLCPCVPCIAAQAVVRVGVRMAGWAVRTGLRSWWCDWGKGASCVEGVATRFGQPVAD